MTQRRTISSIMKVAVVMVFLAVPGVAHAAEATADDTARFLAGMPPSADSPLALLTRDAEWQRHARIFDAAFGQLEQRQLSRVRAWAEINLAAPRQTMFYMFSGPDFLYANAFYSKATTYVLAALEPAGAIPDLSSLSEGSTRPVLAGVEQSLSSILSFSFFITKQMKGDLHANQLSGALPILYVFMARSGMVLKNVELIGLDAAGTVLREADAGRAVTRGARILFTDKDRAEKTLYYFATDLSNPSIKGSGFLRFCDTLAPGNSLIKSASYLLHAGNFSTIRSWLLANSATIIQDDSGIPLSYFSAQKWRFFPFGRYAGPIEKFPGRYQRDYAELFSRAQPIDFGIGYRWRPHESNLLLAVKTASDEPATADNTPPEPVAAPKPVRAKKPRPATPFEWPRSFFFWR